jgi:hypothetical protein
MISSFPHKIKSILTEQPKDYSAKTKFSERILIPSGELLRQHPR